MIKTAHNQFVDGQGRTVMLRGVNLGGSSKMPAKPPSPTHQPENFFEYQAVTFVGRPFPAPEADAHFARLKHWGFNCLRFVITWEAVEHAGPGQYDLIYLDYLTKMVEKAGEYGFLVVIDPHQDVWSRWTGGDGAPAWTLEKAGFELSGLHPTGAAVLHHLAGDEYLRMQWVTNYDRLAAATMFTLFFAGNDFAPELTVDGVPIQQYLQDHYFQAMRQVAGRLNKFDHVIGYDTLNEPHPGLVGVADLTGRDHFLVSIGAAPSPLESMALGGGYSLEVPILETGILGAQEKGRVQLNPQRQIAWRSPEDDLWRNQGVWGMGEDGQPQILKPDYFCEVNGRPVDFSHDYLKPFLQRFIHEIRAEHESALIFVETSLESEVPHLNEPGLVFAPHWYDAVALFQRRYQPQFGFDVAKRQPVLGRKNIRRSFSKQLADLKERGQKALAGPTWLGEFGLSFDLNDRVAFAEGDFSPHIAVMERTYRALDDNLLSGTVWNYTADNTNAYGDGWNGEDLSIFSTDQIHPLDDLHDLYAGGRALAAVVRPYPRATAGELLALSFDVKTRDFEMRFRHDERAEGPTEIFVPDYHYGVGVGVELSDGRCEYDQETQTLTYWHTEDVAEHVVRVFRERGPAEIDGGSIKIGEDRSYDLEHRFIETNGIRLHTILAGEENGQPLVMLHGFPEFWYGWREQIPYFVRQGYRVIVPDQRGYNLSDKPKKIADYHIDKLAADIVGLLDTLGIDKTVLVGHDWGAMVTWWLAASYPERLERAVALNVPHPNVFQSTIWGSPKQMLKSWYAATFQIPGLPERIGKINNWQLGVNLMQKFSAHPDTFSAEDMVRYTEAWSRPQAMRSMLNWYRVFMRQWPQLKNPHVEIPMLLIWGAQDVALSREMARPSIDEYCRDGHLVFIEEATHWVQHDEPERVNRLIGRFFDQESD